MCGVLPADSPCLALVWTVPVQDLAAEAVGLIAGLFCSPSLAEVIHNPASPVEPFLGLSGDDNWGPFVHVSRKARPESTARA